MSSSGEGRTTTFVIGALLTVCLLAFAAAPAGAVIEVLPGGQTVSYLARAGTLPPQSPTSDGALSNLDYNGGPVMPSNTNYMIYWQPTNYASPYPAEYTSGIDQYFTDLAHDSGGNQNVDSVATQYNDSAGDTAAYKSTFGGSVMDTTAYPASGCNAATICLTRTQLQTEISAMIDAHGWPRDLSHEYFIITPPNVASCFGATTSSGCSTNAYCAYHGASHVGGGTFIYANQPYVTGVSGCDTGQHPNGPSDGALEGGLTHEHNESITDPLPNSAWTDFTTGSSAGYENGDKCSRAELGTSLSYGPSLGTAPNGQPYTQVINGHFYRYQQEWSNQGSVCLQRFSFAGVAPTAQFTSTAGSGNTMNFDATGSTAPGGVSDYHWTFEDPLTINDTTDESETTVPTVSHTYSSAGPYTVSLTVYAADGTSAATARLVQTGHDGPTPSFTSSPSLHATGQPITFTSTSTAPSADSIASYSWNFGDGSTPGTGPAPSHSYAAAGTYNATLTVTDALGQTAAFTQSVAVHDPPTASFTVTTTRPLPGQATSFDGSASSTPNGSISSYSWNFGDGSAAGSGATPSHTYAAPGTYSAVLTVTDSAGFSGSSTHPVTVDELPTAAFTVGSAHPLPGRPVAFDGSASSDPDGSISSYSWNFGDGSAAVTGARPSHTYAAAGAYVVSVLVTDSAGLTSSVKQTVAVDHPPSAALRIAAGKPVVGIPLAFDGTGSSDSDGTITSFAWAFGDGSRGTGSKPTHRFVKAGTYSVLLTVTDNAGAVTSATLVVTVSPGADIAKISAARTKHGPVLKVRLRTGGVLTIAGHTVRARKAGTVRVSPTLSQSQRHALARHHRLKLTLSVVFVAASGAITQGTAHVTLHA